MPNPKADAAPFFKPFNASFSVSRGIIPLGKLELRFTLDESGDYRYHAHTRPGLMAGLFVGEEILEESQGRVTAEGLVSQSYRYTETGNEADNMEVRFDWPAMKAHTSSGGVTWTQEIQPGTQDRLSQQLMVRLQLAKGIKELTYQVADGGKLKRYHFQVVGEEAVETPLGNLHSLKVRRSKESRPPDYTIWFAPELDYLPVRIERRRGGSHYQMVLEELEGF
ncbi:MAG: DUF3108 domain-containing protein [Candidatus Thiodiazotropha sp.]